VTKKITDIQEIPELDPDLKKLAENDGVTFVAHSPQKLKQFITGAITLGELEGIDKETQYKIAKSGHTYLSEGKLKKAKQIYEGLLALDPYDAYFHTALGSVAYQSKELESAMTSFNKAIEINPFFSTALTHRGEIRLSQGDTNGAIDDLIKAVDADPKSEQPATQRARALIGTIQKIMTKIGNDPEAARLEAEKALQKNSPNE